MPSARSSSRPAEKKPHPQLGVRPANMPKTHLPTRGDVLSRILALRADQMRVRGVPEYCVAVSPLITQVAEECLELWEYASLPTLVGHRVRAKVGALWNAKNKTRKNKDNPTDRTDLNQLFDIRSNSQKPALEEDTRFLEDQRTERRLGIGPVDK